MTKLHFIICAFLSVSILPSLGWSADANKTGDVAERGLKLSDFPRWHQVVPNVYAYEDTLHAGDDTLTTNSLIIVTTDGVVIVDGQDTVAQGQALAGTIKKITPQPVKYMVIASDHQDHVR